MPDNTIDRLRESGVVAVLRDVDQGRLTEIVAALEDGGVTAIEITADSVDPVGMIARVRDEFGPSVTVGAGTVLDENTAGAVIDAGAEFVVSPVLDRDVIDVCNRRDRFVAPGIFTPTEAHNAVEWGGDAIKLFPATTLGPTFISSITGPLGDIPIMPTGGIDETNAAAFIESGAFVVGAGGALLDEAAIESGNYEKITENAKTLRATVIAARDE